MTNGVVEMDFQELHRALTPPGSTLGLDLNTVALKSESISRLVSDFFGGAFHLEGVEKKPEASKYQGKDAIRVNGRLAPPSMFLGRSGWTVDGSFFVDDGRAEVVLTLVADQWPIADGVELHDCVFTLDSRSSPPLAKEFDELFDTGADTSDSNARKRGLQLAADVVLPSIDRALSNFLDFGGSDSRVRLTGPVELIGDIPVAAVREADRGRDPRWRMRLGAQVGPRLQFGQLNAQLTYEFLIAPVSVANAQTSIRERLTATLTYEYNNKVVKIPLAATFKPNAIEDGVTIAGKPTVTNRDEPNRKAGLSLWDLAGLIPGDLAGMSQPLDSFPELKNALSVVELSDFCAIVRPGPLQITAAYARLQVQLQWEIIKDLVSFEEAALEIFVTRGDDGWDLRPYLTAELVVAGGTLSTTVDPLGRSFSCVLAKGSKIDATKLLAIDMLRGLPSSPLSETQEKFDITWFEITGDPVAKSYSLDIVTDFDWGFDLGAATRLAIKQVFLSLEYTKERFSEGSLSEYPNEQLFFELGGSLAIGGVTISVGAKYDSTHWIVSAAAYDIRLNEILNLLPNVEQLRPVLPEIELPFVKFEVTPSIKAFKFDAEGRIRWSPRSLGIEGDFIGDMTLSLARPDNATLTYDIHLSGGGQLADPALGATLDVQINKEDKQEQQVTVGGTLTVNNLADLFPDGTMFPAVQLGTAVGFKYQTRTSALSFALTQNIAVPGPEERFHQNIELQFAFCRIGNQKGEKEKSRIIAGAFLKTPIKLAAIVGDNPVAQLLDGMELRNLGIFYATDEVIGDSAPMLQTLFDGAGPASLGKGFSFSGNFVLGGSSADVGLAQPPSPTGAGTSSPVAGAVAPAGRENVAQRAKDERLRKWFNVNKMFGPLQIRRIGAEWDSPTLSFLLDASIELVGLKVGLAGLHVGVPPAKLTTLQPNDISIGLDGLEISFEGGPISISGAFLKIPDGGFAGTAMIRSEMFSIAAIGAYTQTKAGDPSLFIYGAYFGVLGGPPCFVVQGLSAGFGYNRGLTVPPVEEVHKFPLVSLVMSTAGGSGSPGAEASSGGSQSMLEALSSDHFSVVQGQYWLAAGIKFTSFKLIDAFALATVQFGVRFELALLGLATMQQPPKIAGSAEPVKPFVLVELALSVRFAPSDGLFAARAVLTSNSYLFDPQCKLTGGLAFCVWFKPTDPKLPDHSGDFVLTVGGYHPRFQVPEHYPRVPRVGFNWQRPEQGVTMKGECYFALTPSCLMAGCRLSATYSSSDFAAWFEANADFLMAWAPFHYEADIGVWIGASYTTRVGEVSSVISFQIGASLSIWGPEFAGVAYVDLGIAAFSVHIGAETSRTPEPIAWKDFCGRFIPHVDDRAKPLSIAVTGGLLREDKKEGQKEGQIFANPAELGFSIETFVPLTVVKFNDKSLDYRGHEKDGKLIQTNFGIRPLAETAIESELTLEFRRDGQTHSLEALPITKGLPEALWSPEPAPSEGPIKPNVIGNALSGVQLFVEQPRTSKSTETAPEILDVERATTKHEPLTLVHAKDQGRQKSELGQILRDNETERKNVVAALRTLHFDFAPDPIDVEQLAKWAEQEDFLAAMPSLVPLGQLPPSRVAKTD